METEFALTGIGIPPYSARGLTQTLEPIAAAAALRRTVNGDLRDNSASQFRKYRSTVTCNDQQTPAITGIFPGQSVIVDCIAEIAIPTGGVPDRVAVPGSLRTNENGFDFYRPRLTMRVMSYQTNRDDFGAACGWTLEIEEV